LLDDSHSWAWKYKVRALPGYLQVLLSSIGPEAAVVLLTIVHTVMVHAGYLGVLRQHSPSVVSSAYPDILPYLYVHRAAAGNWLGTPRAGCDSQLLLRWRPAVLQRVLQCAVENPFGESASTLSCHPGLTFSRHVTTCMPSCSLLHLHATCQHLFVCVRYRSQQLCVCSHSTCTAS
jgi:hypothetical protein